MFFSLSKEESKGNQATKSKKSPGPEKHPKWLFLQKEFNSGMRGAIYCFFIKQRRKKRKRTGMTRLGTNQKSTKNQPKNTTPKHQRKHKHLDWFVMTPLRANGMCLPVCHLNANAQNKHVETSLNRSQPECLLLYFVVRWHMH